LPVVPPNTKQECYPLNQDVRRNIVALEEGYFLLGRDTSWCIVRDVSEEGAASIFSLVDPSMDIEDSLKWLLAYLLNIYDLFNHPVSI
jgi:hypothetical protein